MIASSDEPAFAMPAAAWAARSGDPVLFAQRNSVPEATLKLIERYDDVPVYILAPEEVISAAAEKRIGKATKAPVTRAADAEDPVGNAIAFARFVDGTFGWNINDPGHGFVIANSTRPADAGAAAALSGSGTWGPLLLVDRGRRPAGRPRELPARHEARLRRRPDPRRLQPRLDRRRRVGDLGGAAGRGGRDRRGRADKVGQRRCSPSVRHPARRSREGQDRDAKQSKGNDKP